MKFKRRGKKSSRIWVSKVRSVEAIRETERVVPVREVRESKRKELSG